MYTSSMQVSPSYHCSLETIKLETGSGSPWYASFSFLRQSDLSFLWSGSLDSPRNPDPAWKQQIYPALAGLKHHIQRTIERRVNHAEFKQ